MIRHYFRYLIGIDLGTTNSVLAYIDTQSGVDTSPEITIFHVPQVVHSGEVRALPKLPSFLYFPMEAEAEGVGLPWDEQPSAVAGVMAREQGALVPGRQVASAKSWLCHNAIDRQAPILPWGAEPPQRRVSPVEASACYLRHLRDAWNHGMAGGESNKLFENQEIVLTVPASFDEEARELTVEAAQKAGIQHFTLIEEPLAAFYAWMATHRESMNEDLHDGELVLICDIGGGTSDFSLIRVRRENGGLQFERTAIGEHLLLGGDNLDVALARRVEQKLSAPALSLAQRQALQRACCSAKEHLLSDVAVERVPITVLGGGRAVVGQMISAELTRAEVIELLTNGFLPVTSASEMPRRDKRVALRELGLPYAGDPAITRHLAAFLTQAATAMNSAAGDRGNGAHQPRMERPDAILFNGGFCMPALVRERIADAVASWFIQEESGWRPKLLNNPGMESAVAVGAAHYGHVRRGAGQRIRAGSARGYYIALRSDDQLQGVCVLPAGAEEGTTLSLSEREFRVLANRPASFTLYSSRIRHDTHGEVISLSQEGFHRHAPLVTLLRYGKKLRDLELQVRLTVKFTELGMLELWCETLTTPHRWRLQFELRADENRLQQVEAGPASAGAKPGSAGSVDMRSSISQTDISEEALKAATDLIRQTFTAGTSGEAIAPETLVSKLEAAIGFNRDAWSVSMARGLCDALIEAMDGRRKSPTHGARWLNLVGFCLRPGFGTPQDEARMQHARKIYLSGLPFESELQIQVEWAVLWRRVSGGLPAATQQELYKKYTTLLGLGRKKPERLNSQMEREAWRLLASLEHLPAALRTQLGNHLLTRIKKSPAERNWLWSLGRLGARIPLYGPLGCVVASDIASEWVRFLLELPEFTTDTASAIVQLGYVTEDRVRDLPQALRHQAAAKLDASGIDAEIVEHLRTFIPAGRAELARAFGESLPKGLNLASSPNCLLSVAGLTSDASTRKEEKVG